MKGFAKTSRLVSAVVLLVCVCCPFVVGEDMMPDVKLELRQPSLPSLSNGSFKRGDVAQMLETHSPSDLVAIANRYGYNFSEEQILQYASESDSKPVQRTSLAYMTGFFVVSQFAMVGINKSSWEDKNHEFPDGYRHSPVWDDDEWYYNYGYHPWVGSEYYLAARNRGYAPWQSTLYAALLSTFYEYVPENLITQPSATDLIVTPLAGAFLGEIRYQLKNQLVQRGIHSRYDKILFTILDPLDLSVGGFPDGKPGFLLNWSVRF